MNNNVSFVGPFLADLTTMLVDPYVSNGMPLAVEYGMLSQY